MLDDCDDDGVDDVLSPPDDCDGCGCDDGLVLGCLLSEGLVVPPQAVMPIASITPNNVKSFDFFIKPFLATEFVAFPFFKGFSLCTLKGPLKPYNVKEIKTNYRSKLLFLYTLS